MLKFYRINTPGAHVHYCKDCAANDVYDTIAPWEAKGQGKGFRLTLCDAHKLERERDDELYDEQHRNWAHGTSEG